MKALLLSAVLLCGCATQPASAPIEREIAGQGIPVVINRDKGGIYFDGLHKFPIYVNGSAVTDIGAGEQVKIYVPAGENIIGTRMGRTVKNIAVQCSADKQPRLRIGLNDEQLYIQQVMN